MPLLGITEAALLISMGFGFIIILLGHKEEQGIKGLAHVIGMTIIALSLFFIALNLVMCSIFGPVMKGRMIKSCPPMQMKK